MQKIIIENLKEHQKVFDYIIDQKIKKIEEISISMSKTLNNGGTIFWCGNGGSAADSQHLAAELIGRFKADRRPLRSLALTTDTSVLTCIGNDFGFEEIFARQVEGLCRPNDLLVLISTSGNSENLIKAAEKANYLNIPMVGLLGKDGGRLKSLLDNYLIVDDNSTARIQEAHIFIGHCFCDCIEYELGLVNN